MLKLLAKVSLNYVGMTPELEGLKFMVREVDYP